MSYKDRVLDKIYNFCKTNYKKIDDDKFELGDNHHNRRCQLNAVQSVYENKSEKVYLCIAINKDNYKNIVVHFINKNKSGMYIDNTWGWTHKKFNYYIIRKVSKDEYDNIDVILNSTKDTLVEQSSNGLLRWLFRIDKRDLI